MRTGLGLILLPWVLIAWLLTGCAMHFTGNGGPEQFRRDRYACMQDARQVRNPTARGFNALADDFRERDMFTECMSLRGWERE
jgi:hypothetical protein